MGDFARSTNPAVQAQLDRLERLSPAGDRLGLDRIAALLDRLGRPQDRLPPVFHVAGTNGKGSVCAFLRAMLEEAGRSVHLFTSPHLVRFNERIRIAGKLIEDDLLAELLGEVNDAARGIEPSFFEATTAAALLAFERTPADACILEVGLGGRLDATNIVERPLVCGIAGLGLDHRQFLGSRIAQIAAEKAGIAKEGVPLVTQHYRPAAAKEVFRVAQDAGASWLPRRGPWDGRVVREKLRYRDRFGHLTLPLPALPGRHQAQNAALAVAMLRHQDRIEIPLEAIERGIAHAQWPARMQALGPGPLTRKLPKGSEVLVDGGHNPSAARAIADHLRRSGPGPLPLTLLFASLTSKQPRGILRPFAGMAAAVRCLPIAGHDHHRPEELAGLARSLGFEASAHDGLHPALGSIDAPARVLIFGSLYLAGEALALNGEVPD